MEKIQNIKTNLKGEGIDNLIVEDIFSFIKKIPMFYDENAPPPLIIDGLWKKILMDKRKQQIELIENRDVNGYVDLLNNMFFNELTYGLSYFGGQHDEFVPDSVISSLSKLLRLTGLPISDACLVTDLPNWGAKIEGADHLNLVTYMSVVHTRQAWEVSRLLDCCRTESVPVVLDLGSGYGGMVDKLEYLHPNALDIWLIDIPANLTTAYAYLAHKFSRERVTLFSDASQIASLPKNDGTKSRFLLAPSILCDSVSENIVDIEVVHNSASLSEMDYITVEYYMNALISKKARYFIETNSHYPVTHRNDSGNFDEILANRFPIPESHKLLARYLTINDQSSSTEIISRYLTSIYAMV